MTDSENGRAVDVVGIGALAWDRFLVLPRFPRADEKIRAIHCEECAGGTMATALVALRRWGLGVRIVGVVGADDYSERILADLHAEQVDTERVVRSTEAEGRRSTILVDHRHGTRCVIGGPHRIPPIPADCIEPSVFAGARVLHLDTTCDECGVEAAELARSLGLKVTLDAERVTPRIDSLLPLCDVVIASYDFAREITGQEKLDRAAYGLFLRSERPTIVTAGADGCAYVAQAAKRSVFLTSNAASSA